MPDYQHNLQFATFPEPVHAPAQSAVEVAVLSEQWGYDLVMFRDHPHRPDHLDVLTLMSWVAARTTAIRVAPVVLNMSMRFPISVAKAAASLDLLSDRRCELGLGSGAPWEAAFAPGMPRLTRGQAIGALSEAMDVIRAVWGVENRDEVRLEGEYFQIAEMQPGPRPAHEMRIWVDAYKPRMLGLVGRKADGWAARLGDLLTRTQWQAASARIDEAALGAGRDPAVIRRMAGIMGDFNERSGHYLKGRPKQWVEQLLPSVLEDGVGTFIVASDDRAILQRFAEEVIPELRTAVKAERGEAPEADEASPGNGA